MDRIRIPDFDRRQSVSPGTLTPCYLRSYQQTGDQIGFVGACEVL